jgi:undecaprenyl-diphosphatase
MDYRVYHGINKLVQHHHWVGTLINDLQIVVVPLIAVGAFALWFLARPGSDRRWKLASGSALASAALALLINQGIAKVWHRNRPYQDHNVYHPYAHSHDPSFPSDHASAAFAIAFAVILYDRLVGAAFVAVALLIAIGRVFLGAHYPGDVLASVVVGLLAAVIAARLGRPVMRFLVTLVERVTDPVAGRLHRVARRA